MSERKKERKPIASTKYSGPSILRLPMAGTKKMWSYIAGGLKIKVI